MGVQISTVYQGCGRVASNGGVVHIGKGHKIAGATVDLRVPKLCPHVERVVFIPGIVARGLYQSEACNGQIDADTGRSSRRNTTNVSKGDVCVTRSPRCRERGGGQGKVFDPKVVARIVQKFGDGHFELIPKPS